MIEKSFLFNHDEYKKILQLPLRLRSKLGNLSQMIIIGEEQFSCANTFFDSGLFDGFVGASLAILPALFTSTNSDQYLTTLLFAGICSVGSHHIRNENETFPTPTKLLEQLFFGEKAPTNKEFREKGLNRHCLLIKQPLVPEQYAETLALQKQTEQEFQRLKKNSIKHQQKTSHRLLTHE